tara:strand:- start:148 stop:603 length:456 start_codon:yes stop_codon:yes gene_type:complete
MEKFKKNYKDTLGIRNLAPTTYLKIKYGKGDVEVDANGEVAAIQIECRGSFKAVSKLGSGWIVKAGQTRVVIVSLAQSKLNSLLFSYIGELTIKSAKYVTWDENKIKYAGVENLQKNNWFQAKGNWNSDARKYEEIESEKVIYKKILKTKI